MNRLSAITGLLCLGASAALGQGRETLATLRGGDTVKVWAVGPRLNGELGAFGGFASDTLVLQSSFEPSAVARARVPYASLRRVDVVRGKHRSVPRTVAGVVLGAAGGMLLGFIVGPAVECGGTCSDDGDWAGLGGALAGGAVGIVAGGITGGVIGARPRTNWESVSLRR
jgi:hypothetical protein